MHLSVASLVSGRFMNPSGAQAGGGSQSLTGQLIDIGNYAGGFSLWEYTGVHARACAMEGFDVGLLTNDGKVYYIKGELAANSSEKLWNYMLLPKVTITGEVAEKNDLMTIEPTSIK